MTPQIAAYFLFSVLLVGSALVWLQVAVRLNNGRTPLPLQDREPIVWNRAPVVLAVMWIVYELVNRVFVQLYALPTDVDTEQVRIIALLYVVLWSVLIVLLAASPVASSSALAPETRRLAGRLREFGIRLGEWTQQLQVGALGFLASLLPVWGGLLLMQPIRSAEPQHPFFRVLHDSPRPGTAAWIFLVAVILAPLTEELLFRVILQGWLQSRIRPGWAIGITAFVFSLVHGWADALPLLPLALILGYVYYRRHSYLAIVVTHMLFNGFFLTIALLAPSAS